MVTLVAFVAETVKTDDPPGLIWVGFAVMVTVGGAGAALTVTVAADDAALPNLLDS